MKKSKITFKSFIKEVWKELIRKEMLFLIISFILFVFTWHFELFSEYPAIKIITMILVTISFSVNFLSELSKKNLTKWDLAVNFSFLLMLVSSSIIVIAQASNDPNTTTIAIAFFIISILIILLVTTARNIVQGTSMLLTEDSKSVKLNLFKSIILYTSVALSIIILFGAAFTLLNNESGGIKETIPEENNLGYFLPYYYSAQVFYANSYGDLTPSIDSIKLLSIFETWVGIIIHIFILGKVISNLSKQK